MYPTLTRRTQRRGKAQIKERGSSLAQEGVGPPERGRASIGARPLCRRPPDLLARGEAATEGGGRACRPVSPPSFCRCLKFL